MKLKENFIIHEADGETMLIPTGLENFSGVVKGNRTLGIILSYLKTETTEEQIIIAMMQRFSVPDDIIRRDVRKAVSELRKIGAIDG